MRAIAPAKINLSLHITGKRPDGYHNLDSIVAFAEFGDEIHIEPAETTTLHCNGEFATETGDPDQNLIIQAVNALKSNANLPNKHIAIQLYKHIPVGAGLGGGSSDAATILIMLNQCWELDYTPQELMHIAAPLGADIPMCIHHQLLHASGIGDQITPIACKQPIYAILVFPKIHIPTANIYKHPIAINEHVAKIPTEFENPQELFAHLLNTQNDLTLYTTQEAPVIAQVINAIEETSGCRIARMTGSGACCFGLFDEAHTAHAASVSILKNYPDWWVIDTVLS